MDIKSIQSGLWSNPATWEGGKLPLPADKVIINHIVIIDTAALVSGVVINNVLSFKNDKTIDLTSTGNVVVNGTLQMIPNPEAGSRILFTGINENNFVGGGDTVLDTDIGLWVMGAGQLDLQGAFKTGWADMGWDVVTQYERLISDAINLQRNVRIEGTATGQSHLFIKSSKPQTIKYVQFRYLGPRKDRSGDGIKELVTGRYACHFHHSEDGSRGSIIEGCIARDCNNHCFVPHGSHGIVFRNNIVYNVTEPPFWYDFGHRTHDLTWENNLVVNVKFVARAEDQDSDGAPTFGAGGFVLGSGDGNICRGNVVVGTSGDPRSAGAYIWPELRDDTDNTKQLEDSWTFENNTAINCPSGIQVWQNNLHHHIVRNTTIINCPVAIFHGAYQNHYRYIGGKIIGGYIDIRAASATTNRLRFEEMEIDAAGGDYCIQVNEGPLSGAAPVLFLKCLFKNWKVAAIIDQNPGPGKKNIDVIDCGSGTVQYKVTVPNEIIRVQYGGSAWQVAKAGAKNIAPFAPSLWGTGTGLKAEYYSPDFKTKYLERIEPNVNLFDLTHPSPHYAVPATFAARWTGKIQPQFTETYTFYMMAGGGVRLWVDNKLIIDKWAEKYPGEIKAVFGAMIAGKSYDLKLEFFNSDDRSGCTIEWSSPSLQREFVPMSQLYPGEVKPPDPPVNQKPVADAGTDQLIGIAFYLTGKGTDADGIITGYKWEQVSGPLSVIVTATDRNTLVNPSGKGEYVFQLTVTDDKGANGVDEVKVVVG